MVGLDPSAPVVATGAEQASAIAVDGRDVQINLNDGANIQINNGGITSGQAVNLRKVSASEWGKQHPASLEICEVYEVDTSSWQPGMQAVITLPIPEESSGVGSGNSWQVAYYQNGQWVALPSSMDEQQGIVSASVNHFSFFTTTLRLLGNTPPQVNVITSPQAYTHVRLDERTNSVSLAPLMVDVYASDPEGKSLKVFLSYGPRTLEGWFTDNWGRKILDDMTTDMKKECMEAGTEVGMMCVVLSEDLKGLLPVVDGSTDWVQLAETDSGHYQMRLPMRFETRSPVDAVVVYVRVVDDLTDALVDQTIEVPIAEDERSAPARLDRPGPTITTICPAQPKFKWTFEDWDAVKSYRFRLVKGENLWGSGRAVEDWTCRSCGVQMFCNNGCDRDGVDYNVYMNGWNLSGQQLEDGKIYSWGVAVSGDAREV